MKDYSQLDAAICAHIESGRGHPVNSSELERMAREISPDVREAWRVIDRRMQAMRKARRIQFGQRRWHVCK